MPPADTAPALAPSRPPEYRRDRYACDEPFDREMVPGSRYVDPDYRERQRVNVAEYRVRQKQAPPAPFRVGGRCVYRGDTESLAVFEIKDGVAVIGRDGKQWPEAVARLRGVRE